jgi:hypothetical protein
LFLTFQAKTEATHRLALALQPSAAAAARRVMVPAHQALKLVVRVAVVLAKPKLQLLQAPQVKALRVAMAVAVQMVVVVVAGVRGGQVL